MRVFTGLQCVELYNEWDRQEFEIAVPIVEILYYCIGDKLSISTT
jgi:hypothetical protein